MKEECCKCGYRTSNTKERFGKSICEFCFYFAPEGEDGFNSYVNEHVNWRDIQTYRKQGFVGGIKQKKKMKEKVKNGNVMSRPPFGYIMIKTELTPAENSYLVENLYQEFLDTNLSLNRLAKKYGLSVNGVKKVLTNFTYIGKVKFDKEVHEGKHKPLISTTLFNHVQDKLKELGIKF